MQGAGTRPLVAEALLRPHTCLVVRCCEVLSGVRCGAPVAQEQGRRLLGAQPWRGRYTCHSLPSLAPLLREGLAPVWVKAWRPGKLGDVPVVTWGLGCVCSGLLGPGLPLLLGAETWAARAPPQAERTGTEEQTWNSLDPLPGASSRAGWARAVGLVGPTLPS